MDDMESEAQRYLYIEEFEKMRNCGSTTMVIDFDHILNTNNTLQMAISEQYLRYVSALAFLLQSVHPFVYWILFYPSKTYIVCGSLLNTELTSPRLP